MNTFSDRMLLLTIVMLPAIFPVVSWAEVSAGTGPMDGHWDSVFLVVLGGLIVWREVNAAMRSGTALRGNGWRALDSWRQPSRARSSLMPVLAKLAFRRARR